MTSGIFGTPDTWVEHIRRVADRAGDRVWPMPIFDDYAEQLKSDIADMVNTGGRPAGSITAAIFLKEFSGGLPWAHIDIAGTAWAEEARPYLPKGPSGVACSDPCRAPVLEWLLAAMIQDPGPVIVKIIEPPKDPTGLADVLIGVLGLSTVLSLAAISIGVAVGALIFWVRSRRSV